MLLGTRDVRKIIRRALHHHVLIPVIRSDCTVALAALRQKQAYETELGRIAGTRLTLEAQVNAIETANLNAETMVAMKKGAEALKGIHGSLLVPLSYFQGDRAILLINRYKFNDNVCRNIDKVDTTMESIREQMDLSNEISEAISNPVNMGIEVDDVRQNPAYNLQKDSY